MMETSFGCVGNEREKRDSPGDDSVEFSTKNGFSLMYVVFSNRFQNIKSRQLNTEKMTSWVC